MTPAVETERLAVLRPDFDSPVPLYLQLSERLAAAIHAGFWRADEALPSERALTELLDVSRVTARKALDLLCERGLISRRHGSGTYVAPQLESFLSRYRTVEQMLATRGFPVQPEKLECLADLADQDEMLALGLAANARVWRIKRWFVAGDVPFFFERASLPVSILDEECPGREGECLDRYRASVVRVIQKITAVPASPALAAWFGLGACEPLLSLVQQEFSSSGQVVVFAEQLFRGRDYSVLADLRK
ncbi:GntR family transcriptional regulator [Chitinilyticum litopenaei]|uniref:GntR family transcriptional regulator n=1 Tax=Chitinilyticum litopenaei TaxID=1121276 RepID=UPI000684D1EA|nr:GntR family transcriptional regulator [Chitinilyticum litopenaei]